MLKQTMLLWLIIAWSKAIPYIIVRDLTVGEGGVGVLFSNRIKLTTWQVSVDPKVAKFEHMELVITVSSITIRLVTIYRMPRSKRAVNTDGEHLSFCDEFSNYIEKLSCASGVILLAGDFNVDWLDGNGLEVDNYIIVLKLLDLLKILMLLSITIC